MKFIASKYNRIFYKKDRKFVSLSQSLDFQQEALVSYPIELRKIKCYHFEMDLRKKKRKKKDFQTNLDKCEDLVELNEC